MKYDVLKILKDKNQFISGEELGEIFNVSRAAIWKVISKLKEEGYSIISVTNKGYLLKDDNDIINSFEIIYNILPKSNLWKKCFYYDKISSTNNEAKIKAFNGEAEGTIVIADEQYEGKGRQGKMWTSPKGTGMWLSVILKPDILPTEASQLTLIAGIAICKAIRKTTDLDAFIKWPNDIVINGKKVSGTLTEMSAEIEMTKFIIIGMGINVNIDEFPDDLKDRATSLLIEGGKLYSRREIILNVLLELEKLYFKYIENNNTFAPFKEEYKSLCVNINKNVKLKYKNEEIIGVATDISDDGQLIVKDKHNNSLNVFSGEVSVRLTNGNYV